MLSIVIPAWNEQEVIARTIESCRGQEGPVEVLLVDAGSSDDTVRIAQELGAAVIASAVRQRAAQMNLGAREARGEVFLFLHADTILPRSAAASIRRALEDERAAGGAFERRFATNSLFLKWTGALARVRNRVIGWHLGDQGIFARRGVFEALGGFAEFDRFEDLDFSRRMRAHGRVVTLRPGVVTSARRFARHGGPGQTARDFLLTMRYLTGDQSVLFPGRKKRAGERTSHAHEQPS